MRAPLLLCSLLLLEAHGQSLFNVGPDPLGHAAVISRYQSGPGLQPVISLAGTGQVWDFSMLSLSPHAQLDSLEYMDPASTPYFADFPDASLAARWTTAQLPGFHQYNYYELTFDAATLIGRYNTMAGVQYDSIRYLAFPFSLGQTISATEWGVALQITLLAEGTLYLPCDTIMGARLLEYVGGLQPYDPTYHWVSADDALRVAATLDQGGLRASCREDVTVGSHVIPLSRTAPGWPNPFSDRITWLAEPGDERRIMDGTGKTIRVLRNAVGSAIVWDGRDARGNEVPVGIYVVRYIGPGVQHVERLVKL